jgi:hypothetical protein
MSGQLHLLAVTPVSKVCSFLVTGTQSSPRASAWGGVEKNLHNCLESKFFTTPPRPNVNQTIVKLGLMLVKTSDVFGWIQNTATCGQRSQNKVPPTEAEVDVDGRQTSRRVECGKFCYLKNKKLDTCGGRGKLGKCQFTFCLMTISKETNVPHSKFMCSG